MLYYILFWTLLGFIIHFYIIFGTNLLTGGPAQIVVFLPISVFRRKGISNVVQTEWNLRESYFSNGSNPGDLEWASRKHQGGHEAGRRAPTLVAPLTDFFRLYILLYPENIQEHHETLFPPPQPSVPKRYHLGAFLRSSAGGGIDHGGLLHQHHRLSDDVWVVYLRPSGP